MVCLNEEAKHSGYYAPGCGVRWRGWAKDMEKEGLKCEESDDFC